MNPVCLLNSLYTPGPLKATVRATQEYNRHHCTYWEIRTTINGQQTDPGLNLQLNRLGFILTYMYSTNKSTVEERYALKAYKVSIIRW